MKRDTKLKKVMEKMFVSLWSGEDGMELEWGLREELVGYLLDEDNQIGGEELIEDGIESVIEYDTRFGEMGERERELVRKFREVVKRIEESEVEVSRVYVWSVEYDVNVSVVLSVEVDWEGV